MGYGDGSSSDVGDGRFAGNRWIRLMETSGRPTDLDFGTIQGITGNRRWFTYHGSFQGSPTVLVSQLIGPNRTPDVVAVAGTPGAGSFACTQDGAGSVDATYFAIGGRAPATL